ncbi:MAG: mechanosensitive ion channel family protein [Deltaproteobacteria bacterium]|nr:mechanosensitive ion channel family protein [Deltaproteobacteria bacterium]
MELCRTGQYTDAARYLELPARPGISGPDLARRLKAVLDRFAWIDLEVTSPLQGGKADDGLPPGTDEIARIAGTEGGPEPVRLVYRARDGGRWIFSRATVNRIDGWYERIENRWLLEHLPAPLLRPGPQDLLWWQWLALPFLLLLAWAGGYVLSRISRGLLARIAARTATRWDDEVLARIGGPLTVAWAVACSYLLLPWLGLYAPAREFVHRCLRASLLVVFFWALARSIDVARQMIAASPWAKDHPGSRSLLPLGARVGKVVVVALAAVALLSELGYPVASLIAGLGIGGLAVALAAQKTVENLFGAFSIGADQPFRVGDFVRIEDFTGTVETIGLRSTRIRTLDRTLISIPNGKLAEMRVESFAARDRIRLACTVGVVYGTTAAQLREILSGLEQVLREHPKIWPEAVVVRFEKLGASSLDLEVMAWFQTSDWAEFQLIRQEVLIQFMERIERAGSSLAFPTRTVHLAKADRARAG